MNACGVQILSNILLAVLVLGAIPSSAAEVNSAEFAFSDPPARVRSDTGLTQSVTVRGLDFVIEITVAYTYPNGKTGIVVAEPGEEADVYTFRIPPEPESPPGDLTYSAEALHGDHGTDRTASTTQRLPVSFAKELDITGEAAEVLLYPLAGEAYTVRYVPCCNIYGGMTLAERIRVNPVETGDGLPEQLLSDFVVLEPDGLSASTMGMYFDFNLGPGTFDVAGDGSPALFEFDGAQWVEVQTYELDREAGTVSFHCPTGGEYVLGVKP